VHDYTALHSFPTRRSSDLNLMNSSLYSMSRIRKTWNTASRLQKLMSFFLYPAVCNTFPLIRLFTILKGNIICTSVLTKYCTQMRSEEHTSELQSRERLVCR